MYIRLVEVEWSTGTGYYVIGNEDVEVGAQVYQYGIVKSVSLNNAISLDNDLESASMRVVFNDPLGTFKALFDPAAATVEYGAKVTYKYWDGVSASAVTKKIMRINRPSQSNPPLEFEVECVGNYGSLDQDSMFTIETNECDVPDVDVVGQVIPIFGGTKFSEDFQLHDPDFLRGIPSTTGMTTGFYFDSVACLNMYTRMVYDGVSIPEPFAVYNAAGDNKTAGFAVSGADYDFNNGETGKTSWGTDNVVAAVEFIFPKGYDRSLIGHVQDIVDTWDDCERVDPTSATNTAFTTAAKLLELQDETAAESRVFYCFTRQRKGREILKMLCDSIGCHWRLSGDNKIELFFVHPLSMAVKKTFTADENGLTEAIKSFKITNYDCSKIVNDGEFHSMYDDQSGEYLFKEAIQTIDGLQSQEKYSSVYRENVMLPNLWYHMHGSDVWKDYTALNAAKWHRIMHRNPEIMANVEIDHQDSIELMGGDIISFKHPHDVGNGAAYRYYVIQSQGEDSDQQNIQFNLKDITDLHAVDTNCKSLIHARYPYYCLEGDKIIDEASGANVMVTFYGGLLPTADANGIWGGSFHLNGSTQYIKVTGLNETQTRAYWDITAQTNFTISCYIQFDNPYPAGAAQCVVSKYVDASNYWRLVFNSSSVLTKTLAFRVRSGGTNVINIVTSANIITDYNLHHTAVVKIGDAYGIYLDGVQVGYTSSASTYAITSDIEWGRHGDGTLYTDGKLQEMRISHGNIFNAAPNVGLTNTITPPANGFDCEGVVA
jgi:hypothetical protein